MWALQKTTSETSEVGDADPGWEPARRPKNATNQKLRAKIRFCKKRISGLRIKSRLLPRFAAAAKRNAVMQAKLAVLPKFHLVGGNPEA